MYYDSFYRAARLEVDQRLHRRKETKLIVQLLSDVNGDVLEIGSNLGYLAKAISGKCPKVSLVGIDTNTSEAVFWFARWRNDNGRTSFLRMSGLDIDYPNDSFDRVIVSHLIEHFQDPGPLLEEAKRVLKSDGRMIVVVPREDFPRQLTENHERWFPDAESLKAVLRASQIRIVSLQELPRSIIAEGVEGI